MHIIATTAEVIVVVDDGSLTSYVHWQNMSAVIQMLIWNQLYAKYYISSYKITCKLYKNLVGL